MKALKRQTLGAELAHPVQYEPENMFDDHLPTFNTRRYWPSNEVVAYRKNSN